MMESDTIDYGLIVSFPDQTSSYAYGYEAGMIWARLEAGELPEATTRIENREVLARMANALKLDVTSTPTGIEGWDSTVFLKPAPPKRGSHLSLVK